MDISEFLRLNDKKKYVRHPWETSRKDVLHTLLKKSKINFPINRIVDVGSGDAYILHSLIDGGFAESYFAIDTAYTEDIIQQIKENNNKNCKIIYLSDIKTYQDTYDNSLNASTLFLCMDVLEHLEDEKIILDFFNKKSNNYYFFSVPAFQSLYSSHDELLGHYRRYTLKQLSIVLTNSQFEIIDRGYYFLSLLFIRGIGKILNNEQKKSIDNWDKTKTKTKILNILLYTDFKFSLILKKMNIILPGLSTYCICKK